MSDLVERARLTEEEKDEAWETAEDGDESDALAAAATVKALWAVVEWLEAEEHALRLEDVDHTLDLHYAWLQLKGVLYMKGIQRPTVEVTP